jgi:hypothetical protein
MTNFGLPVTESQTRTSPPSWPSQLPWAEASHLPSGEKRGNQISRTTLSSARVIDAMTGKHTKRTTAIDESRARRFMIGSGRWKQDFGSRSGTHGQVKDIMSGLQALRAAGYIPWFAPELIDRETRPDERKLQRRFAFPQPSRNE